MIKSPVYDELAQAAVFSLADSADYLLSLKAMDKVITLDPNARTVTIEAGMSYGTIVPLSGRQGICAA
jgi:xylitol oxidase